MVYFVSPFKVSLLLWTTLIASSCSASIIGNLSDARIITSFLEKIIKPYISINRINDDKSQLRIPNETKAVKTLTEKIIKPYISINRINDDKSQLRIPNETKAVKTLTEVENAIWLKIIQLEPMLQDSKDNNNKKQFRATENKIKLQETTEPDDETTIIEFVPEKSRRTKGKSALKETKLDTEKNIEKFKQLRQHITLLLSKENTSRVTNKLITKTLDEMLSLLIEGQCKGKTIDTRDLMKQILKNTRKSMDKLTDNELDQYKLTCYVRRKDKDDKPGYNDNPSYSGNGNIKSSRSFDNEIRDKTRCANFVICSDELRRFLKTTYNHLNDTAVSTFTNYAAMYTRDIKERIATVNDDVTKVLENISKSVEPTIIDVFIQQLERFTLDENKNNSVNIEHIDKFITDSTEQVKTNLSQFVEDKIKPLEIKFIKIIKDDLMVNLRMDMDNLSERFKDKICFCFEQCNGINAYETTGLNKPRTLKPTDSENVYVNVQVSFDDELKDSLLRFSEAKINSWQGDKSNRIGISSKDAFKRRRFSNVNVTRTTIRSTATTDGIISSENGLAVQFF